ncbi:MAG TPA: hypothetical protein PLD20_20760 [Blastocatellia bacterium]|nr:hypothetical protein [Blastocatellia bacterium]HMV87182.1 hypothetical protein [Blastocatellia bacterium]HMX26017.1 hypothetical protein [Blastocatellia bacterium]HMZ20380.1 hypothetical protein [Blastocatellia bacterium]HNG31849.1 hypothetical protein [Blastocatellia bacterium]
MNITLSLRDSWREIARHYRLRKALQQPDLRRWEYFVQMLISAYLSWRWIGPTANFRFWEPQYWAFLSHYSHLGELATRARLAEEKQRPISKPSSGVIIFIPSAAGSKETAEWPKEISVEGDGA